MKKLSPEEAADLFEQDPNNINIALNDMCDGFNLTPAQLLTELKSGRLKASTDPKYRRDTLKQAVANGDVYIKGKDLLKWMAITGRTPVRKIIQ